MILVLQIITLVHFTSPIYSSYLMGRVNGTSLRSTLLDRFMARVYGSSFQAKFSSLLFESCLRHKFMIEFIG